MTTSPKNLEFTRTKVRGGYLYTIKNNGEVADTRNTARNYSHVVVDAAGRAFGFCGRLDLAQQRQASEGAGTYVLELSATLEAEAPKRAPKAAQGFLDFEAVALVPDLAAANVAKAQILADDQEFHAARNHPRRTAEQRDEAERLTTAYWERRNATASPYAALFLAERGWAVGMLLQLATTYRGVVNPVFIVQPGKTSTSGYELVMMKAPGQATKIVVNPYNFSTAELASAQQLVATEKPALDTTGWAPLEDDTIQGRSFRAAEPAPVELVNVEAAAVGGHDYLDKQEAQHQEAQAVGQVREMLAAFPVESYQHEMPVQVGQEVVAQDNGTGAMIGGTITEAWPARLRAGMIDGLHPIELRGYRELPWLGQLVLAVRQGRLVGGHVVAVNYSKCHVLLCSGYWVSLAEWDLGVSVGYTSGTWYVENPNRLPYLPGPNLAAVKRARKARRRARAKHWAAVWANLPHPNLGRWAAAETLEVVAERLAHHATWPIDTLGDDGIKGSTNFTEDAPTLRALLQNLNQPKWRQLK